MAGVRAVVWAAVAAVVAVTGVRAQEQVCVPITGTTFTVRTKTDAAAFPAGCTLIRGSVDVSCRLDAQTTDGGLTNLAFLSQVVEITGSLTVEDCDLLPNLDDLASLRVIGGEPDKGLSILNNDLLTDFKALENLQVISRGGVSAFRNARLCYLDLFQWNRLVGGERDAQNTDVNFLVEPASCLALECDGSCSCGFCAGPGACSADCEEDNTALIVGPIVAFVVLVAIIALILCYCHKRGRLSGECYCNPKRPIKRPRKVQAHQTPNYTSFGARGVTPLGHHPEVHNKTEFEGHNLPAGLPKLRQQPPSASQLETLRAPADLDLPPIIAPAHQQPQAPPALPPPEESILPSDSESDGAVCVCGKPAEFDCSRCENQGYCSSQCQRDHWREHREACSKARKLKQLSMSTLPSGAPKPAPGLPTPTIPAIGEAITETAKADLGGDTDAPADGEAAGDTPGQPRGLRRVPTLPPFANLEV